MAEMLMDLSGDGCEPFCESGTSSRVLVGRVAIMHAGPMPSSLNRGFSLYMRPLLRRANPVEETTNWRAVCGKTACTVRRTGRTRVLPDPYLLHEADSGCKKYCPFIILLN